MNSSLCAKFSISIRFPKEDSGSFCIMGGKILHSMTLLPDSLTASSSNPLPPGLGQARLIELVLHHRFRGDFATMVARRRPPLGRAGRAFSNRSGHAGGAPRGLTHPTSSSVPPVSRESWGSRGARFPPRRAPRSLRRRRSRAKTPERYGAACGTAPRAVSLLQ